MPSYAEAGVDRQVRAAAKKALEFSTPAGLRLPFNVLFPSGSAGSYWTKNSDGVGTKVLLAQLAKKHDTIGIDAIAMVANDCIRCGAQPVAFTDTIDVKKSTPELLRELAKGLDAGARESGAPIVAGETADVPELLSAEYQINADCLGAVSEKEIIHGKVSPGDVVIGLRSSGIHSNGVSLLRRALFTQWGGRFDAAAQPDGLDRELVLEALEPTRIYVKPLLELARRVPLKAAVHITGDAYLKFKRLGAGFEFDNFKPQPIFELLLANGVAPAEFFKTFNAGWGFAVIVDRKDADSAVQALPAKLEPQLIGRVTDKNSVTVKFKGEVLRLD
jgi:phosphoribosylformylglycinamidine cyclo-ligase